MKINQINLQNKIELIKINIMKKDNYKVNLKMKA